jgi:HlyD family secretion protein
VALEQAAIDLRAQRQLARQGFIAPTKLDGDRLAVQAAQKELEAAVDGEHIARHDLEQARVALGSARAAGRRRGGPPSSCVRRWPGAC